MLIRFYRMHVFGPKTDRMNKSALLETPIAVLQQEQRLFDMLMWSEFVNLRHFCVSRQL